MAPVFIDNGDRDVGCTGGDYHTPVSAPSLTTVMWRTNGNVAHMPNTAGGMACTAEELKQIKDVKLMKVRGGFDTFKPPTAAELEQDLKQTFPHLSFAVESKSRTLCVGGSGTVRKETWELILHIGPGGAGVANQAMERDGDTSSAAPPVDIYVNVDPDRRKEFETLRDTVPESLRARGVSEAEWQAVHDALLEFQNANFWFRNFGGCGGLAECCYYCFPLGPLQACLCSSNPLTKSMCIEPEYRAVDVATAAIVPVVSKHNVYFAFRVPFDDERAARFWAPTVVPK